ncbi:hypothetical protein LINPERHAP1_LOCUS42111 [Linum perenne]
MLEQDTDGNHNHICLNWNPQIKRGRWSSQAHMQQVAAAGHTKQPTIIYEGTWTCTYATKPHSHHSYGTNRNQPLTNAGTRYWNPQIKRGYWSSQAHMQQVAGSRPY